MDKVNKQARFLYKKLKGELTVPNVIKFLDSLGYDTVFFNTDDGDELALRYGIDLNNIKALTYFGITRVVFVDDELHADDKLYVLLHECGHILLGHLDENQMHSMSELKCENEAEVFTYAVMHQPRRKWLFPALLSVIFILLFLCTSLFVVPSYLVSDELVYVTRAGDCYHRASCIYATNYDTSQMYKSEAKKTLSPCCFCQP